MMSTKLNKRMAPNPIWDKCLIDSFVIRDTSVVPHDIYNHKSTI